MPHPYYKPFLLRPLSWALIISQYNSFCGKGNKCLLKSCALQWSFGVAMPKTLLWQLSQGNFFVCFCFCFFQDLNVFICVKSKPLGSNSRSLAKSWLAKASWSESYSQLTRVSLPPAMTLSGSPASLGKLEGYTEKKWNTSIVTILHKTKLHMDINIRPDALTR